MFLKLAKPDDNKIISTKKRLAELTAESKNERKRLSKIKIWKEYGYSGSYVCSRPDINDLIKSFGEVVEVQADGSYQDIDSLRIVFSNGKEFAINSEMRLLVGYLRERPDFVKTFLRQIGFHVNTENLKVPFTLKKENKQK